MKVVFGVKVQGAPKPCEPLGVLLGKWGDVTSAVAGYNKDHKLASCCPEMETGLKMLNLKPWTRCPELA